MSAHAVAGPSSAKDATEWHYEIQHGPDGEANYAWVYCADELVCVAKTHHAIAIVEALSERKS